MQFLKINNKTTLSDLSDRVGNRNLSSVLGLNSLTREYNIGAQYENKCNQIAASASAVDWQRKSTILNSLSSDSDVFEYASLLGEASWKVLSNLGTFPGMLKIPETISIPDSVDILGDNTPVKKKIYKTVMYQIQSEPHTVDPSVFNEFSTIRYSSIVESPYSKSANGGNNVFEMFNIPWGDITLYSSLADEAVDIPVYPEEVNNSVRANYTQMPDLLYQYEPWQVYQSSGPRSNTYDFHLHRDMWTGDHRDGKCNELIRFFEAQCYAKYQGASVNTSIVTLYVKGKTLISGIVNDVSTTWTGPIGLDGWYLECTLSITITEVAEEPLNFDSVRQKPIIG